MTLDEYKGRLNVPVDDREYKVAFIENSKIVSLHCFTGMKFDRAERVAEKLRSQGHEVRIVLQENAKVGSIIS